jgi:dTDP-4-dehydrorhamnose 3,5-epimerase
MKFLKKVRNSDAIEGFKVFSLDAFQDFRGEIWTVYSNDYTDVKFVSDKVSVSRFGVLRGFHGDPHTAKLITCLSGQMQFAAADLRKDSPTYGNVESFIISDNDPTVVLVPAGCVNAHLSLSDKCVFYYKWSEHYAGPESQVTVAWNDPDIAINWAIPHPILAERDKKGVFYNRPYRQIEL